MDLTKLGRTERILAIVGILAFVDTFLPWYTASAKGELATFGAGSYSSNGWSSGFAAWFPLILLIAIGVVAALPAFGRQFAVRGGYAAIGAAALVATLLILIRWLTYPSVPADEAALVDAGADFGTYIGLILGVVATVFSYLAFTASGGSINRFGDAFKTPTGAGPADV